MILCLDVGNAFIKGALFEDGRLNRVFRMRSEKGASVAAYRHTLQARIGDTPPERVGIASVVPEVSPLLEEACTREFMVLPEPVHSGLSFPFVLKYRTPDTLGSDRLAAAAAAYQEYRLGEDGQPRAVVVVDAGSAVNYEVLDRKGQYLGGAIAPGPFLSAAALSRGTARLPQIELAIAPNPVGRSTDEALRSGVMWGFADSVAGMVRRLTDRVGRPVVVVGTGGQSTFLESTGIVEMDFVDPHLVLKGILALLGWNPPG